MKQIVILIILFWCVVVPASALEIEAPPVPESGRQWMPENRESFGEGLLALLGKSLSNLIPELKAASRFSARIFCIVLFTSVLQSVSDSVRAACDLASNIGIFTVLMGNAGAMITLGIDVVREISDYGKLLLPVMTAALAAQGGIATSAALYTGTAIFNTVLSSTIVSVLLPGIKLYLVISIVSSVTGEELLKRMAEIIKSSSAWILKSLMMVFTTYLGLSGVVSGATDLAALKAAKVAISSVVPVVGGILSDASEAVLVSASIVKNTAGIYGILAILAVCMGPFLRLLAHYLVLKLTAAVCTVFGGKTTISLIDAFSTAMGFLLAVTGGCCIMVLISTVCFMRSIQ